MKNSKEEKILDLFFNNPSKHWHFEEILKKAKIARSKAGKWLRRFIKEGLIRKIKERGKMPYYTGYFENPAYRNRKKIYALDKFYRAGLLNHLASLPKAKTVILFGSFARSDWNYGSDIDVFIYGDDEGLDTLEYQAKLRREIQLFTAENAGELHKFGQALLRNILSGIVLKGTLNFVKVSA